MNNSTNHSRIDMNMDARQMWQSVPLSARIVGGVIAVALIGASVVASVFLAGALLFAALVVMAYGAIIGKRSKAATTGPIDAEATEIKETDEAAKASPVTSVG